MELLAVWADMLEHVRSLVVGMICGGLLEWGTGVFSRALTWLESQWTS